MAADPSLDMAIQALSHGDRDAAMEALLQLTAAQPSVSDVWLWLAAASVAPDEKRMYLRQALELAPKDRRVVAALGKLGETVGVPEAPTATSAPAAIPAAAAQSASTSPVLASPAAVLEAPLVTSPLAVARFSATGVQAPRMVPWRLIILVGVLVLLIPLGILLV